MFLCPKGRFRIHQKRVLKIDPWNFRQDASKSKTLFSTYCVRATFVDHFCWLQAKKSGEQIMSHKFSSQSVVKTAVKMLELDFYTFSYFFHICCPQCNSMSRSLKSHQNRTYEDLKVDFKRHFEHGPVLFTLVLLQKCALSFSSVKLNIILWIFNFAWTKTQKK